MSRTVLDSTSSGSELALLDRLRSGDEAAFLTVVGRYHASMVRVALNYVSSVGVAEEVVQETWVGVLRGLSSFEGRASLRTWVFRILTNVAKRHGQREARCVPLSSLASDDDDGLHDRFLADDHQRWPGHWAASPEVWGAERLQAVETLEHVRRAIQALPPTQRDVITLRDVEGFTSEEVCDTLDLSEANQRVLLHRARSKVRAALEDYLRDDEGTAAPFLEAVSA